MSLVNEWKAEGAVLEYEESGAEIVILSARVNGSRVKIPDRIEDRPVTKIGKKAFLSCKLLKEVFLPESLVEIGDWAFAYCSGLETIWIPEKNFSMGKGILKECERLSRICRLNRDKATEEQVGRLMGAVPVKLEADYLFLPQEAGGENWLRRFDERLREFLARPDEDGFVKMVYCGEEDIVANVEYYLAERRREKARLCFLRLINSPGLSDTFREKLQNYLCTHTRGCASEAAWEVVFYEHGSEKEYYEAFAEAGCLTEGNYDAVLMQMGDQYPEMKAFVMRCRARNRKENDLFDFLSLD